MKDEILKLCLEYLKIEENPEYYLKSICRILIPKKNVSNNFIRELIAFVYEIDTEELVNSNRETTRIIPKIMYRKMLYDKYSVHKIVASKCNITHSSSVNSIKRHNELMETNTRYRETFELINKFLYEL